MKQPNLIEFLPAITKTYIRSIRNADKRRYAELYAVWRHSERTIGYDHSGGPEDPAHNLELGYMARQAVRMKIEDLFGNPSLR